MAEAILFTGGSVFDGTAFLAPGTSVLVSGGRVTAVGTVGRGRRGTSSS